MTDRRLTPDEQAFLAETGLRPDDVAPLVEDAPPLPTDALARIRSGARAKAGIADRTVASVPAGSTASGPAGSTPLAPAASRPAPSGPGMASRRRVRRWLAAAAAVLLLAGGAVVLNSPERALAAIQRLVRLVPGIGLTESDSETWILPEPASVELDGARVTVTGFMSTPDRSHLQFRVDLPPLNPEVKTRSPGGGASPELRLPDGTVQKGRHGFMSGGSRYMVGEYSFAPLPAGTSDVTVVFPYLSGVSAPVEIPLSLVNAEDAGLAEAYLGGWSDDRSGIQVGVPYWTAAGDRIVLSLDAVAPEGIVVESYREFLGSGGVIQPGLRDDRGRTYPLITEESDLSGGRVRAVFRGPLAPDAGRLTLAVPSLRLEDRSAEAPLTVPLEQLPEGKPLRLDEDLRLGSHRFTVRTVTRLDADTFRITLDLGTENDGSVLQFVGIRTATSPFGREPTHWSSEGNLETGFMSIEVDFRHPPSRNLEVVFVNPEYRLDGGWEVELAVPPRQSR